MKADFDSVSIQRPELAASYLGLLASQPGRPLALFGPRRLGKTWFLDQDLTPAARERGWLPVYADLWLQRGAPLAAINHALEEALDDASVPAQSAGKLAKTPVPKLSALGVSVDLGAAPTRRKLPEAPELRFDALIQRLHAAAGRPVLLMLDEAQALAEGSAASAEALAGSLRAVLHKRRQQVYAVLTGSSPDALAQLLATAGAPMYHFAQVLNFPALGDEFLKALAEQYGRVHKGRKPLLDDLRQLFERLGHKPALMRDVVKSMSAEGETDVQRGFAKYLADERHVAGWRALIDTLGPLERGLARAVAAGLAPLGQDTRQQLGQLPGVEAAPTVGKVRAALERLRKLGVLTRSGAPQVEDPFLQAWLLGRPPV
ncbi:hypothetical protein [Inhella sp.]|uniref:hypothetical protein n=1 Tax=Inhella sp. TaxID=1921806 RepID=UPI0035B3E113